MNSGPEVILCIDLHGLYCWEVLSKVQGTPLCSVHIHGLDLSIASLATFLRLYSQAYKPAMKMTCAMHDICRKWFPCDRQCCMLSEQEQTSMFCCIDVI